MRAVARRLWLSRGISDRPHVDRQPRAPHLGRRERNPERVDRLVAMKRTPGGEDSVITRSGVEERTAVTSFTGLREREHQSLVIDYNDSASPYPADKTIIDLFEAQVARTPEVEAIRLDDQSLTYRELNDRANQMAAHLGTFGVGPDHLVALYMEHSIEVVCAMLGVLKSGAAYVPVDPVSPQERLVFLLQDIAEGLAGALPALVTQSHLVGRLPSGAARVVTLDDSFAAIAEYPVSNPRSPISPNSLAYVIYTSGSTGTPKGVMIKDMSLRATKIRKLIVGGEDFKTELARDVTRTFGRPVEIYNEYGPTEATVGCMIHRYDVEQDLALSVPIGIPAANAGVYILDEHQIGRASCRE